MNTDNVINPYELLGIDPYNPDIKVLKKNYYRLVLRYHPDKGGSEKKMRIIQNAYNYIKLQFQNCQNYLYNFNLITVNFKTFWHGNVAII